MEDNDNLVVTLTIGQLSMLTRAAVIKALQKCIPQQAQLDNEGFKCIIYGNRLPLIRKTAKYT